MWAVESDIPVFDSSADRPVAGRWAADSSVADRWAVDTVDNSLADDTTEVAQDYTYAVYRSDSVACGIPPLCC